MTSRIAIGAKYVAHLGAEPILTSHIALAREFDDAVARDVADRINEARLGNSRAIVKPCVALPKRNLPRQQF